MEGLHPGRRGLSSDEALLGRDEPETRASLYGEVSSVYDACGDVMCVIRCGVRVCGVTCMCGV